MQYFAKLSLTLLAGLGLLTALPVWAAGTNSGTSVDNSVTLDYTVNGGAQPTLTDNVSFVVDRKLQLDVTTVDSDWITVTSGQEYSGLSGVPAINFTVTNMSNDSTDVVLGVVDQNLLQVTTFGGVGAASFDEDAFIVAIDDGATDPNNRRYDSDDTIISDNGNGFYNLPATMAEDDVVNVMIVVDVPAGAAADEYATYTLVAAVADSPGVPTAQDQSNHIAPASGATPDPAPNLLDQVEVVFADEASGNGEDDGFDFFVLGGVGGTGADDADYDGQVSDSSGFVVAGVSVLVAKYAEVIYDPVSDNKYDSFGNTTGFEPKAIPGAVIMYVVGISNEDAVFAADGISVADDIPDNAVGLTEPVDEGNQTGSTVYFPDLVTVDFDPGPGLNNVIFDLPGTMDLDAIYTEDCLNAGVDNAYSLDTTLGGPDGDTALPEVAVSIGQCLPGADAFVVYFVTVETDN